MENRQDRIYGYIRVSSKDQNEARQVDAMKEYGIADKDMYIDKMSGKDFNRPEYMRLMKKLKQEDVLVIKSIDRLGRNYSEIIKQWNEITRVKGCDIVVIDMPLLDTRRGKDLTGTLISDIVLQLLSYVAQTERENIRQRQAEGIRAAKARGIKFGRKRIVMPPEFSEMKDKWRRGEISSREAGSFLGISHQTFLRNVRRDNLEETSYIYI